MKLKTLLGLGLSVLVSIGTAQAYLIDGGVEVGGLDTFLGSGKTKNSNPNTEIAEFADLGLSLTYDGYKTETVEIFAVTNEEDPANQNYWAFALQSGPGYYLIKNANGKKTGINVLLFENNSSYDWGVVEWANLLDVQVGDSLSISHVTEFNSFIQVPEPATFGLLALGLTGLFASRRKRSL
jgi:hypothetical protein